jgi:hypothetical protein
VASPRPYKNLLFFCQKVTFFLSKNSRELAPEKPRFYSFFSVYIFAARLQRGVFFVFPPACFFGPDPKILLELASKDGRQNV